jgi:hypothetical protein
MRNPVIIDTPPCHLETSFANGNDVCSTQGQSHKEASNPYQDTSPVSVTQNPPPRSHVYRVTALPLNDYSAAAKYSMDIQQKKQKADAAPIKRTFFFGWVYSCLGGLACII